MWTAWKTKIIFQCFLILSVIFTFTYQSSAIFQVVLYSSIELYSISLYFMYLLKKSGPSSLITFSCQKSTVAMVGK